MPVIDLIHSASLVDYVLYAFMAMNVFLPGTFLIHRGVRRIRAAR